MVKYSPHYVEWTFKTWLECFKNVQLPIGDFANEFLGYDDFLNDDEYTYYEIFEYVAKKSMYSDDVIDTFRTIWEFYVSSAK